MFCWLHMVSVAGAQRKMPLMHHCIHYAEIVLLIRQILLAASDTAALCTAPVPVYTAYSLPAGLAAFALSSGDGVLKSNTLVCGCCSCSCCCCKLGDRG